MSGKILLGLSLGLIGLASAGCSSAPGIVRAQSPGTPDAVMAAGPGTAPVGTPANPCPQCGCTDGTCSHCLGHNPHHRFWAHYAGPDAANGCGCCSLHSPFPCSTCGDHGPLVYPPNPTPGAIVQYPYYTCKGPDDFFFPSNSTSAAR
jgi:hypothetical protein